RQRAADLDNRFLYLLVAELLHRATDDAALARLAQPVHGTLVAPRALNLGQHPEHLEHDAAHRRGCVDILRDHPESDTLLTQLAIDPKKLFEVAPQAIKAVDDKDVAFPKV